MRKKTLLITGVAAAAVVLGGATVAVAAASTPAGPAGSSIRVQNLIGPERDDDSDVGDDDSDNGPALSAADWDKAANAALAKVGQGRVSEVERENEGGSAYEVEVRLDNGSEVEVQVGADFQVLNQSAPEADDD
ncbi:PepSY domain-containing protein [Pseudarthrobacter sp. O4]|uniref:PepSY domain-containing protein n=1 Tax=Pseudarthrobacter sp. O4 TaxID=3418417 RepID=UPI003CEEC712